MPRCINVLFDNENILPGFQQRNGEPIGIKPLSVTFLGNHQTYVTRCQTPLVLSFAYTIHKVQGLSLENAVCDIISHTYLLFYIHLIKLIPKFLDFHYSGKRKLLLNTFVRIPTVRISAIHADYISCKHRCAHCL